MSDLPTDDDLGDHFGEELGGLIRSARQVRLSCGHREEVAVGERLWCHYDVSFGVVTRVGTDGWHDFTMDGSPYKATGSHGLYDSDRLTCIPCGLRDLARRRNDRLVVARLTWEVVRP